MALASEERGGNYYRKRRREYGGEDHGEEASSTFIHSQSRRGKGSSCGTSCDAAVVGTSEA